MIYDVAIIGAGMAGASVAAHLPRGFKTIMLEAEAQPGYHTTGRSAAFYTETYGGRDVQPLTTGSKSWFFESRLDGHPMVTRRGALHIDYADRYDRVKSMAAALAPLSPGVQAIDAGHCLDICPVLRAEGLTGGVWDPDCCDIDVSAVHAYFLAEARKSEHQLLCDYRVEAIERMDVHWRLTSATGDRIEAAALVNAAGAWGDDIARRAGVSMLGLVPHRRTVGLFDAADGVLSQESPLVLDLDESFYFKPQSGSILVSPADETPSPPCDAQPDMEDIATGAWRVEQATSLTLARCVSRWAGLRTFAPDRSPVFGFDRDRAGFFWCVGQGGFGIQTAPAAGRLCAALLMGKKVPHDLAALGISANRYAPERFSLAA